MPTTEQSILAIGLMSGTSADGMDAALIRTDGESTTQFNAAVTVPYNSALRERLLQTAKGDVGLDVLLRVENELTEKHAVACQELLRNVSGSVTAADIAVIGFHGHTIRHLPEEGLTWQIGNASLLAERLSIPVISDFRRRDLAAGGQGAPLAALFHQHALAHVEKPTLVLNLGGVANVTWLGPMGEVAASDTGPGCGPLDAWVERKTGQPFDRDGALASRGTINEAAVESALLHEFFSKPLPKSADRFDFTFSHLEDCGADDGAATLCAITVAGVMQAVAQLPMQPKSVWVTGGGAKHPSIMQMLRNQLPNVQLIDDMGLRSDSLEAECFAWLAVRRLRGLATSLPETSGASHATSGGILTT